MGRKTSIKANWILCSQRPEDLNRYSPGAVWINQCRRCGEEQPVYQGPLDAILVQSKAFIDLHSKCR